MKRENLYVAAGALLASTALTTAADAGVFGVYKTITANSSTVTTTAVPLSAQLWAATPATSTSIGPVGLAFRFNQGISSKFNAQINVTNAKFNSGASSSASSEVRSLTFSATTQILAVGDATIACSLAIATDKILLTDCTPGNSTNASIAGLVISQVVFDNATALATAGTSITLDGTISVGGVLFEPTSAQAVLTSRNSYSTTVTAATGVSNINVNASPAFTKLADGGTSVVIGTINVTPTGAFGADLSSAFAGANAHNGANIKITSAIFSDDATNAVRINGTTDKAATVTDFAGGSVTFTLTAAEAVNDTWSVEVSFNGTSQIDVAAAGTVDVTYTVPTAGPGQENAVAPPGLTGGAVAGVTRNGLTIDINGIQPGVAQGARTYTSLLRIANTGTTAGTVAVRLVNENTGATLGTYTSAPIPAGGSLQVSSAQLEAGAGITGVASIGYRATVTGSITGYVQHVNWNQDAGFFSDLSGRRSVVTPASN
jgi:hypothetical protein